MREIKDTKRATVRIGFDGRVHKVFRGHMAAERWANEVKLLRYLEQRGCDFVPRVLQADEMELLLVTSNCGARVEHLSEARLRELFRELEGYGVKHQDKALRNVTYRNSDGRFCVIDFEFAQILDDPSHQPPPAPPPDESTLMTTAAPVTKLRSVRWAALTHVGRVRTHNEDALLSLSVWADGCSYLGRTGEIFHDGQDLLFAVSDGMGGARAGEFASRLATEKLTQRLPRLITSGGLTAPKFYYAEMQAIFAQLHIEFNHLGESYEECRGMGATLTMAWLSGSEVYWAHIGDTRLYHLPKVGALRQITQDDTHVGWMRAQGQLNEREARQHPRRHSLDKVLGGGHNLSLPQVGVFTVQPGDRLLLASDGFYEAYWDQALEEALRAQDKNLAVSEIGNSMLKNALYEGGKDNLSLIAIEVG